MVLLTEKNSVSRYTTGTQLGPERREITFVLLPLKFQKVWGFFFSKDG